MPKKGTKLMKPPVEAEMINTRFNPDEQGRKGFTDEAIEQILHLIEVGNYPLVAAEASGISRRTWYRMLKKGREDYEEGIDSWQAKLLARIAEAKAKSQGRYVAIMAIAAETDWRAAAFVLERTDAKRWGQKQRNTTTLRGDGKNPVLVQDAGQAAKLELMEKLEKIRERHDELNEDGTTTAMDRAVDDSV